MPSRSKSSRPLPAALLRDAFAAPHPPDETLEEGFHGKVLEQIVLPGLTRGERWRASLQRMGIPAGGQRLRDKLAARKMIADLRRGFGGEGAAINHPAQLAPFLEALIDLPDGLVEEQVALESGLAGLLIEYRYKYSIQRGLMCYYAKMAKREFIEAHKKQKIVNKINDPGELSQILSGIREKYLLFIRDYVFACLTREDILKGKPLFADFITALLFLARIGDGGSLEKEPDNGLLPGRSLLLFLAMRDQAFVKAAADEAYQRKMAAVIKEFPP